MAKFNITTLAMVTLGALGALFPLFESTEAVANAQVPQAELQLASVSAEADPLVTADDSILTPSSEPEMVLAGGGGMGGAGSECIGGSSDGAACDTELGIKKCEKGGGACATFIVTCKHDGGTNECSCECSNILPAGTAICENNLAAACRRASNGSWDPDGTCTYSDVDAEDC